MQPTVRQLTSITFTLLILASTARGQNTYTQTNLVADSPSSVTAKVYDSNLINPWGVSFTGTSPLWVSNQGTGTSTLYNLSGSTPTIVSLVVPIPNAGSAPPSDANGPTGQVATSAPGITTVGTDFNFSSDGTTGKAAFIFDNLDGTISAWKGGTAQIVASVSTASFTGLAIGNTAAGAAQIYAADQNSNNVYVFNSSFSKIGSLVDPNLPANSPYTAFNVQNIGGTLFVTYANPNNPQGGIVDEFSTDGTFLKRLIDDSTVGPNTHLDTPWGVAVAPAGWGAFGGDLLVGNNDGDGRINAYDSNGNWQGSVMLSNGHAFSEDELWAIYFGTGGGSGSPDKLYFVAGLTDAAGGLLGSLSIPEPSSAVLGLIGMGIVAVGWRWRNRRHLPTA